MPKLDNSHSNVQKGKAFQLVARNVLKQIFGCDFDMEVSLPIGLEKCHFFDLASPDRTVIAECKAYSFTSSGNIPSAKITGLREAAMWLNTHPGPVKRVLLVQRQAHPRTNETLGHYFGRLNRHSLANIALLEISQDGDDLSCLYGDLSPRTDGENLSPAIP
jgi:hypothetical protein